MVIVNVLGRLGADAELVSGKNGQFLSFRMATDDRKSGEKITTWFRVTLNGDRAPKIVEYLTKGKLVNVIGTESVGTYQAKDGTTQVSREINASNIEFVSVGSGATQSEETKVEKTEIETGVLAKKEKPVPVASKAPSEEDDLPF